eukprot:COSAG02_NODE_59_length_43585_cov_39.087752_32_plen_85_part_00
MVGMGGAILGFERVEMGVQKKRSLLEALPGSASLPFGLARNPRSSPLPVPIRRLSLSLCLSLCPSPSIELPVLMRWAGDILGEG